MNLGAGPGLAVTEFPGAHGPSDYLLYVDGLAAKLPAWRRPLPFQYETTGQVTPFTNWMEPHARSRNVFSFHRPGTLLDLVQQPDALGGCLQTMPEVPALGLWPKQHTAVVNLEKSLALGKLPPHDGASSRGGESGMRVPSTS